MRTGQPKQQVSDKVKGDMAIPESRLTEEDLKKEASIAEYVQAAASSSAHARNAVIVLVVASILMIVHLRNTSWSWMDVRIEVRQAALKPASGYDLNKPDDKDQFDRSEIFLQRRGWSREKLADKDSIERKLLEDEILKLQSLELENNKYVHLPFFGITVDSNDVELFAGLTFSVVLLWLRFSLIHEIRNLKLIFGKRFNQEEHQRCYELLAMQQVLTVPPQSGSADRKFWRAVPKVLFVLPLCIYVVEFIIDLYTGWPLQDYIKYPLMWVFTFFCSLFLLLIIIFTAWCLWLSHRIDKRWDEAYKQFYVKNIPVIEDQVKKEVSSADTAPSTGEA